MEKLRKQILITASFSLAVVTGLVVLSDPGKFFHVLENADKGFLALALVVANLPLLIYAFTWQRMLEAVDIELRYLEAFRILLANTFINNVTPFGNIGGEAAATYIISSISGQRPGKIFSAVFSSSLINFSPLFSLLVAGLAVNSYIGYLAGFLVLVIFLLFFLYLGLSSQFFSSLRVYRRLPERVTEFLEDFRASMIYLGSSRLTVLVLLVFSHVAAFLDLTGIILVGMAFGVDLLHPLILLVVPLGRLSNYFPTPGGTGAYEAGFTGLLVFFFGVSAAEAVSVAVAYRFLTYYVGLLAGYFSAVSLGFNPEILQKK